ncbi:hypothetical protein CJF32_00006969 [Rutstroemia sp. NJR-2017a WRK4]|nr:hypothetical protein CJF32_00006969 [Rutstroemia sp. NJR-2017a WRK4]
MPPRRSHKKSKAGCQRCVSCDFAGSSSSPGSPVVHTPSSLHRQSTEESLNLTDSESPASASTIMPFYKGPSDMIRNNPGQPHDRSLELRLMHHYTALTAKTLSNNSSQQVAWSIDIPAIAYDRPYLMDAILAVSALHLRSVHPNDQSLVRASHGYMASALAQYSSLLNQGVSEQNAEALFSTAALVAFQASASRRFEESVENSTDTSYVLPLAWFHSFQGVKTVVITSWQWLRNSQRIFPIINGQPPLILDLDPDRQSYFAFLLEGVDSKDDSSLDAETRRAYEHSVGMLNWAQQKPERARILGFAATVSRRFIELMGQQDPRTLVITACFFAMTRIVDDIWWLQGVARKEVMGILSLLPEEWWPKMEWPLRIVQHEGEIDEETWGVCWHSDGSPKLEEGFNGNLISHIDMLAQLVNNTVPPVD